MDYFRPSASIPWTFDVERADSSAGGRSAFAKPFGRPPRCRNYGPNMASFSSVLVHWISDIRPLTATVRTLNDKITREHCRCRENYLLADAANRPIRRRLPPRIVSGQLPTALPSLANGHPHKFERLRRTFHVALWTTSTSGGASVFGGHSQRALSSRAWRAPSAIRNDRVSREL